LKRYQIGGLDKFAKAHDGLSVHAPSLAPPSRVVIAAAAFAGRQCPLSLPAGRSDFSRSSSLVFVLAKKSPQRLGAEVANLVELQGEMLFI
jgi:hypothetical protein